MTDSKRIHTFVCPKPLSIEIHGTRLAITDQALVLVESNYPVRYYIPRQDVNMEQLARSQTQTFCPYKGQATYYSFGSIDDVAWSYETPNSERSDITMALCFANTNWFIWPEGEPEI